MSTNPPGRPKGSHVALLSYVNEPCGVCGEDILESDLQEAVFTGYRPKRGRVSRASHGRCWRSLTVKERNKMKASMER